MNCERPPRPSGQDLFYFVESWSKNLRVNHGALFSSRGIVALCVVATLLGQHATANETKVFTSPDGGVIELLPPSHLSSFAPVRLRDDSEVHIRVTDNGSIEYSSSAHRKSRVWIDRSDQLTRVGFDHQLGILRTLHRGIRVSLRDYAKFGELLRQLRVEGKAYPIVDRAYVYVERGLTHEQLMDALSSHPFVRTAQLEFDPRTVKTSEVLMDFPNDSQPDPSTYNLSVTVEFDSLWSGNPDFNITVTNHSSQRYSSFDHNVEYTFSMGVIDDVDKGMESHRELDSFTQRIFSLDSGESYTFKYERFTDTEMEDEKLHAFKASIPHTDIDGEEFQRSDFALLETDGSGEVITSCQYSEPSRGSTSGEDALFQHQWSLKNTGQHSFANENGTRNADVNMDDVLDEDHPTGLDVQIALVDTGIEICHPDLDEAILADGSINFVSSFDRPNRIENDPFNPDLSGDHGTSVAGVIGAESNNRLGIRGIARLVWLRAFNYVHNQSTENWIRALGGDSDVAQDVDIFNLSVGYVDNVSIGMTFIEIDNEDELFRAGTEHLRDGLGALYVKAAGNNFNDCLIPDTNEDIGCGNALRDPMSSSPFVVTVGALNADGVHASYSNSGTNLWLTAPGGSVGGGSELAPVITVDQYGTFKGYSARMDSDHWSRSESDNPSGVATYLAGTSVSVPHVSAAIALLLEEASDLTWRDIKYVLAKSARKPEPNVSPVRIEVGDSADNELEIQQGWTENAAGLTFHNLYGFGALDVDAAVELARSTVANSRGDLVKSGWLTVWSGWQSGDFADDSIVPNNSLAGVSLEATIPDSGDSLHYSVEGVQVSMLLCPGDKAELHVEILSPSGTKSILTTVGDHFLMDIERCDWVYLSTNAFYLENAIGTWTLKFVDTHEEDITAASSAYLQVHAGVTGTNSASKTQPTNENAAGGSSSSLVPTWQWQTVQRAQRSQ